MSSDSAAAPRHPAPQREEVPQAALWFGLFGGFAALSIHVIVDYAVASYVCFEGPVPARRAPSSMAWWTLAGVSAFALIFSAAAVVVAYRSWRSSRHEAHAGVYEGRRRELLEIGEGRTRFMAMAGLITSSMLLTVILFNSLALFLTPLCSLSSALFP